ncbi:hypothetical protein ABID30_002336 [Enterococcus rotai]|uniref:Uncharacterized protein n=1 Tax=Enterococcus rotai TaxID=118060 RepID=A0A0U2X1Y7_9ENTE|nr:hypothetical protein [Enterococcus rotai]ALS38362.1 hypothetical protein ATZ35_14765 [Enterococcus rotai]
MKKILCIHAHFSNIPYLTQLFQDKPTIVLEHYVIPDFLEQITTKSLIHFIEEKTTEAVIGILITCTMYSNLVKPNVINHVPVMRVEDPLVAHIVTNPHKKKLVFSNPKTVDQTVNKIETLYNEKSLALDYEVFIVPNAFDLILTNQKTAYQKALFEYLFSMNNTFSGDIYLMQLSMSILSKEQLMTLDYSVFTILDSLDARIKNNFNYN